MVATGGVASARLTHPSVEERPNCQRVTTGRYGNGFRLEEVIWQRPLSRSSLALGKQTDRLDIEGGRAGVLVVMRRISITGFPRVALGPVG
jgi:hypothetical protein